MNEGRNKISPEKGIAGVQGPVEIRLKEHQERFFAQVRSLLDKGDDPHSVKFLVGQGDHEYALVMEFALPVFPN